MPYDFISILQHPDALLDVLVSVCQADLTTTCIQVVVPYAVYLCELVEQSIAFQVKDDLHRSSSV